MKNFNEIFGNRNRDLRLVAQAPQQMVTRVWSYSCNVVVTVVGFE